MSNARVRDRELESKRKLAEAKEFITSNKFNYRFRFASATYFIRFRNQ